MIDILWYSKTDSKGKKQTISKESMSRSVVKAISWRILGTIDTVLIAFLISGAWRLALSIGLLESASKMILYIIHERIWCNVRWGVK
jgi:uncharacterized membrane protein